jgi:hypothetical protein
MNIAVFFITILARIHVGSTNVLECHKQGKSWKPDIFTFCCLAEKLQHTDCIKIGKVWGFHGDDYEEC